MDFGKNKDEMIRCDNEKKCEKHKGQKNRLISFSVTIQPLLVTNYFT